MHLFRNKAIFDAEEFLAPRPTPKLDDHPLSAVRDCLSNIFAATLHIGGRSSIRNLRTPHAVVTGTGFIWLRLGAGGGACKRANEASGSIKCGEFMD